MGGARLTAARSSSQQQRAACAAGGARTLVHHKADAVGGEDALVHREALLVLPTKDLEDVALELVPNVLTINLRRKPLVVQRTQLLVVVDIDELLATRGGVGNI